MYFMLHYRAIDSPNLPRLIQGTAHNTCVPSRRGPRPCQLLPPPSCLLSFCCINSIDNLLQYLRGDAIIELFFTIICSTVYNYVWCVSEAKLLNITRAVRRPRRLLPEHSLRRGPPPARCLMAAAIYTFPIIIYREFTVNTRLLGAGG